MDTQARSPQEELLDRWIDALESGRYTQAQGVLRRGDAFCCIGVLCDLVNPEVWRYAEDQDPDFFGWWWGDREPTSNMLLPLETSSLLAFLMDWNDNKAEITKTFGRGTFTAIATYLRDHRDRVLPLLDLTQEGRLV